MNEQFIKKCIDDEDFLILNLLSGDIDWSILSKIKLPYVFLYKNRDSIIWNFQSTFIDNKTAIEEFKDYIDWKIFCCTKYFKTIANCTFLSKYRNYIYWDKAILQIEFTDNIMTELFEELYTGNYISWIFRYDLGKKISCEYLDNISEYFDNDIWAQVSRKQLDSWFIEKHSENLDWRILSEYQSFSIGFIKNNMERIKWNCINGRSLRCVGKDFIRNEVLKRITSESTVESLCFSGVVSANMLIGTKFESLLKSKMFSFNRYGN